MRLFGTASLIGTSPQGSTSGLSMVAINSIGQTSGGVPYPAFVEALETTDDVKLEEITDLNNELIGFVKTSNWFKFDVTMVPAVNTIGGTTATATAGLIIPNSPSAVLLYNFHRYPTSGADYVDINGVALYRGGGIRTIIKGIATIKLPLYKPRMVPTSFNGATGDFYIGRLCTPV